MREACFAERRRLSQANIPAVQRLAKGMTNPSHEHLPREPWTVLLRRPPYQAGAAAAVMLTFLLLGLGSSLSGAELGPRFGYQIAATALLMFGLGNALLSLGAKSINKYWSSSFVSFLLLAGLGLIVAKVLSGLWISEGGSYKWIYMVLTFGYLVVLSIMSAIRGIVNFAEDEEWSQPRSRDRE